MWELVKSPGERHPVVYNTKSFSTIESADELIEDESVVPVLAAGQ